MYDIAIIGSGLSSKFFLSSLRKKGKKIALISPENLKFENKPVYKNLNKYIQEILPPRFKKKKHISNVINFYKGNKIIPNNDCSIFGYLNKGGVSNYWGGSSEFLSEKSINFLNKKEKKQLINSFKFIYSKYNFTGEMFSEDTANKSNSLNHLKLDPLFKEIIKNQSDEKIRFFQNCIASNFKNNKILKPIHLNYENSKGIKKFDYFVNSIEKIGNFYYLNCVNKKKKISIKTKKIVIAAGTMSTTRLICQVLNHTKSVTLDHNPMMFGLFFLKKKIKNENFSSSKLAAKIFSKNKNNYCTINFRSSNSVIRKKIFNIFPQIKNSLSKSLYKILENRMIFLNLYLDSKYGNLNFTLNNKNEISIKVNKKKMHIIKKELNNNFRLLKNYFVKNNLIYPFAFKLFPKMGSDNHYTGTIPINGKSKKLSLNSNCELKGLKNIYIIDGSAIPKNKSKFPTALIISNAYRIGLNFK